MKKLLISLAAVILCLALASCGKKTDAHMLLYLGFDEGKGVTVSDAAGRLPDKEVSYGFTHAVYMDPQDPQWRKEGVSGGCLLLDGCTNFVSYSASELSVSGRQLTVSAWLAPRTFEWDDPYAASRGTDTLTGVVSQNDKGGKKGFILGYQRFGALSFQVGTGDDWYALWTNGDGLKKYEWNYIAATYDADAGKMCLYLNGELAAERSVAQGKEIAAANRELIIGRNGEGGRIAAGFQNAASGYIDEVKLYDRALTAEEISKGYGDTKVPEIDFSDIWLQNILTDDRTRPQFHAAPYQFWMNEPHAPVYYNGTYHLFFQQNMTGPYWRNIQWGHWVSADMVNWRPVREAIVPTKGTVVPDGVWSGGAALDKNGVPLLFFTAGNDGFRDVDGLISNQNVGVAYPADLTDPDLVDWVVYDKLAVIQKEGQGRAGEFRDASVWKEGDIWCMLVCSGSTTTSGGTALLYTSETLELKPDGTIDMDWQYKGPVYEMEDPSITFGSSWELPILLPLTNKAGNITKYFFCISPAPASSADNKAYYYLGDFDLASGTFSPDEGFEEPHILDYGCNVFTGPSALVDPVSGDTVLFSIMQDQRDAASQGASGWAHTAGITRKIWLSDDGTDVMISPIDALAGLEEAVLVDETDVTLDAANEALSKVSGDMLHIVVTADVKGAASFGIDVLKGGSRDCTTFTYDTLKQEISGNTLNKGKEAKSRYVSGALHAEDGKLTMDIYVDRSLVEAFFNEYKAISIRSYVTDAASKGVALAADGSVTIERLYVAKMGSIFD